MLGLTMASLFTGILVYFTRKDKLTGNGFSGAHGFGDIMQSAPPRKTASDIIKIINSSKLEAMDADDILSLFIDAQQTLVRPNMPMEEAVHVRQTLFTIALALHDTGEKGKATNGTLERAAT